MTQSATVRACPLCGSKQISVVQVDAQEAAVGVTCVLKCVDCGSVVKLSVLQSGRSDSANKKA